MRRSIVYAALTVLSLCMTACLGAWAYAHRFTFSHDTVLTEGVSIKSARSCTNQGQVHVPCEDELALEPSEKFLITLVGHSCYKIRLSSQKPLDVFFYEAEGSFYAWRLREMQAIESDIELLGDAVSVTGGNGEGDDTSDMYNSSTLSVTTSSNSSSFASDHLCDHSQNCHRIMHGLSRRGVYNLVMAYSRDGNSPADVKSSDGILLSLESCDEVSLSHVFGLLLVACMGFVSVMLCMCLLGEYALGLSSMTKFRRTLQRHHFVELTQLEPKKDVEVAYDSDSDNAVASEPDFIIKSLVQPLRVTPVAPTTTAAALTTTTETPPASNA